MAVDERSEVSFSRNVAVATVRRHCCYDVIAFRPYLYAAFTQLYFTTKFIVGLIPKNRIKTGLN